MPRISRVVAVGYPHHITQRGNYRQTVFKDDEDYLQYLQWLGKYSKKYLLKIWAYCLLSNHVHFVGVPMKYDSLSKTFNTLHMRYSQYFNKKNGVGGHLWQGRFYSCALDEDHLYASVRYVENNPVRAGIIEEPHKYKWSSARSHVYKDTNIILSDDCPLVREIDNWLAYLMGDDNSGNESIRENTINGMPCGKDSFVRTLEKLLGRELMAKPAGRPCKK